MFKGFKKAYDTPTLPDHIINFTMHPTIRIIRVLGGVSFFTIMSKSYLNYHISILFIAMFFLIIFFIYHTYLSYHRIKHMIKILKSDKLEVRNSPLDRLAFLSARALWCFKTSCEAAPNIGLGLGLMVSTDEILKYADVEPVFGPFLGSMLKTVLPDSATKSETKMLNKAIAEVTSNNVQLIDSKSLLERFKGLNIEGVFTNEEFSEFKKLIQENQEQLQTKNSELRNKIIEILDKKVK